MGVTDAQGGNAEVKIAHVQLGHMSAEDQHALDAARRKGKEKGLTNEDVDSLPMWRLRRNWVPDNVVGKSLMLKVQVPLDGSSENGICMAYDEKREFNLNISKQNCPEMEFLALLDIISNKGSAGGFKAFIPAQMPDTVDGQMVLNFEGLVPKLPW